jgi:WD40-like Beta Propeller Repeat
MRLGQYWMVPLVLFSLNACGSGTPTPSPIPTAPRASPSLPPTFTFSASTPANPSPRVAINLITPTPPPTEPAASPTALVTATLPLTTDATAGTLQSTPEVGSTNADAALVAILQRCWHLSDPSQLNGTLAEHRDAFDCARADLANLAQNYPSYPLVHRVIAWGYIYKDNDISKAVQEYTQAATLYHAQGDRVGESASRMRLGLLLASTSLAQACSEIAQAGNLDPTNDRALTYYGSYGCGNQGNQSNGGTPVTQLNLKANLDEVRGKILFKSDRGDGQAYFSMDPDGGNQKPVNGLLYAAAIQWEAWSPDHLQVAVVRSAGFTRKFGFNNDIWITDPSGGGGRPLANPADDYDPVWSPGGLFDGYNWIAFVSNRGDTAHGNVQGEEIWIMHPDATNSARLTCHGPNFSKHPSWSPDSSRIVFYSNYPSAGNSQIYVIDLSGMGKVGDPCLVGDTAKNLSNDNFNDTEPVWVK